MVSCFKWKWCHSISCFALLLQALTTFSVTKRRVVVLILHSVIVCKCTWNCYFIQLPFPHQISRNQEILKRNILLKAIFKPQHTQRLLPLLPQPPLVGSHIHYSHFSMCFQLFVHSMPPILIFATSNLPNQMPQVIFHTYLNNLRWGILRVLACQSFHLISRESTF